MRWTAGRQRHGSIGGAGTDTLNGGIGATRSRRAGHDTYVVDVATDSVDESTGAAGDLIPSRASFHTI